MAVPGVLLSTVARERLMRGFDTLARLLAHRVEQAAPQPSVPSASASQRPAPAMAAVPVVVPVPVTRRIPAMVRVGARQPAYSGGVAA